MFTFRTSSFAGSSGVPELLRDYEINNQDAEAVMITVHQDAELKPRPRSGS